MAAAVLLEPTCSICAAVVEHHCNTCGDALCDECKEKHLKSNASRDHIIVPYAQKVELPHVSHLQCNKHNDARTDYWCESCDKPACFHCVTSTHKGHNLDTMTAVIKEKRVYINTTLNEIHKKKVNEATPMLTMAKEMTKLYENGCLDARENIILQASEVYKTVQELLHIALQNFDIIKARNLTILHMQERVMEDVIAKLSDIQRQVVEMRDKEGLEFMLFDKRKLLIPAIRFPQPIEPSQFNVTLVDESSIRVLFGIYLDNMISPVIEFQFNTGYDYSNIACVGDGLAWIQRDEKRIELTDRNGTSLDTIKTDFIINDITCNGKGVVLISDYTNNCIKYASRKLPVTTIIDTESQKPSGICILHNGNIIVTFRSHQRVVQYTNKGEVIHEFDKTKLDYPRGVAENKVNKDIYVCNERPIFREGRGNVVAFDVNHKYSYTYLGHDPDSFDPCDLCTNSFGHILIADFCNNKVHILDKNGTFSQYLVTDAQELQDPWYIDIDSDDYVWVGEYRGHVKILRYLKL